MLIAPPLDIDPVSVHQAAEFHDVGVNETDAAPVAQAIGAAAVNNMPVDADETDPFHQVIESAPPMRYYGMANETRGTGSNSGVGEIRGAVDNSGVGEIRGGD